MEFWYNIVQSYDNPEIKNPGKRDDGTFSQRSVIMLLIYLLFGEDYPYHIARFFQELPNPRLKEAPRSSTLRHTGRIGTLLNKMSEDELVIASEKKENGRIKKYYRINPRIIQTLVRGGTYHKRDGSRFEIPLEKVEKTLAFLGKHNEKNRIREKLFKNARPKSLINFYSFIYFFNISLGVRMANHIESKIDATNDAWEYRRELERLLGREFPFTKCYVYF